jgi:hypothetical protein
VMMSVREFRQQLRHWKEPLVPSPARRNGPRPRRTERRPSKPKEDRREGEA